jgi:AraC-like DNA-binding protein
LFSVIRSEDAESGIIAYQSGGTRKRLCHWPSAPGADRVFHQGDLVLKANNLVAVSLATDELPESDRVARWREHFCQVAYAVEIAPEHGTSFRACVSSITIPGLQLLHGNMSPAVLTRTAAHLEDGITDLAFFINRSGSASVHARGRDVTLLHGDAVLMSSAEATTLKRLTAGSSTSLRLSRSILASLVPSLEDTLMTRIPEHDYAIRMLDGYLSRLQGGALMGTPELRQVVVSHVYDLVAIALGAVRDGEESAKIRGTRAARLERAKAFIIENINRMDLSVAVVASHLGVGARYLQRLFEEDGSTFCKFVLEKRLARAHRMLSEPVFSPRAVSTIAYDVGFGDLSYFHRSFRKHYGTTPLGVRHAARESSWEQA